MTTYRLPPSIGTALMTLLIVAVTAPVNAALTDISNVPLVTTSTTTVPPNLMFVLDDSGSMDWDYMPDKSNAPVFPSNTYGYASSQCNGVYYDPAITYTPPIYANGTSYSNASFNNAWINGFKIGQGTVDLSAKFKLGLNSSEPPPTTGVVPAFYYKYTGTQTSYAQKSYYNTDSTFYKECNSLIGASPGSGVFTKVTVGAASGPGGSNELQNFANWFSYYRTRIQMMKTAAGQAFKAIDNHYRVGFMTINNNVPPLQFNTFDATQKNAWYTQLYSVEPGSATPLREALANAGRIYARKLTSIGGTAFDDPVQYSCQQNFTILSTDGFWNGTDNNVKKLDGTTMDNQDGASPRPYYDGSVGVTVIKTVSSLQTTSTSGCGGGKHKIKTTPTTTTRTITTGLAGDIVSDVTKGPTVGSSTTGSCTTAAVQSPNPKVTVTTTTSASGPSNTLADVAQYYYVTDLRDSSLGNCAGSLGAGTDVCENSVPSTGLDAASWQHMTTFTLGLGARGRMVFSPSYLSDTSGDYFDVKNGNPASTTNCMWMTSGAVCNWPTPAENTPEAIDDLWHAAVNGRGTYFSATDPSTLASALSSALAGVSVRTGSTAAATTSNPNVTAGDNFVFSSTYTTLEWDGELVRQQLDLATGGVDPTVDWAAQKQLDDKPYTARTIYASSPGAAGNLKPFNAANFATDANFSHANLSSSLSQFCASGPTCLSAGAQAAAAGANLVKFLAGDRSNEGPASDTSKYYRQRQHVLGDIVDSEARYVKAPRYNYSDPGYSAYALANAGRPSVVYVGANDGMLHAFDGSSGDESWAFIPSMVLPALHKLADKNYSNQHQFYVDGTPITGDICASSCATSGATWKTILVGGLGAGGRGYYALDITNPASPQLLWEFTDANLGYTFGNPVITKLKNGTWVVVISSGYNNVNPGDGVGRLYVLDAATGAVISTISTGVGSPSTPSGLGRISAWADAGNVNNTALRVYGGDLLGNLWRFDINNDIGVAGNDAHLMATLGQPITTKPSLGLVNGVPVVFVGTGLLLGVSDLTNTDIQSIYGIKDQLNSSSYGDPHASTCAAGGSNCFVQQTYTISTCPPDTPSGICSVGEEVRLGTNKPVDFSTGYGWYADLPAAGERDNTDSTLALGTLVFNTNVPTTSACTIGGYSYRYFVDYSTGGLVSSAGSVAAVKLGNSLATRPVVVQLPNNTVISLTRLSGGGNTTAGGSGDGGAGAGAGAAGPTTLTHNVAIGNSKMPTQRVSWRELNTEQ